MITIKVISSEGWQNGKDMYDEGALLSLDCEKDTLQAYIDEGILEVVQAEKSAVKPTIEGVFAAELKKGFEAVVATMTKTANDGARPVVSVHERAEDNPNWKFKSFAHFAQEVWKDATQPNGSVLLQDYDKHAIKNLGAKTAGHMSEGDNVQGGHLVPEGFRAGLLQTQIENTIIRQRAMYVPMATNSIGFPALNDYNHATPGNNLFGALRIYRPAEAGTKTAAKPYFDKVTLTLHKTTALTYVSDRLLSHAA